VKLVVRVGLLRILENILQEEGLLEDLLIGHLSPLSVHKLVLECSIQNDQGFVITFGVF
jgi:hypothetical protein